MKRFAATLILIPLAMGIMSGIYTRKTKELPEIPLETLEEKAFVILEHCPLESSGMRVTPIAPTKAEAPGEENSVDQGFQAYDIGLSEELQKYTFQQCKKNGLEFELVLAVMQVESNFKSDLISRTNDYGLMQINKVNHEWLKKELGVTDFLDPKQNIDCGIYMLKELFDKYSDEHKVLMAYNFGEGGMKRNWKKGVRSSKYSRKVLQTRERLVGGTSE